MSNAAFILTKDVKHLATWTADREQDGYVRGSYRPMCGGKVRDWRHTFHAASSHLYDDENFVARAERLPVCRYCLKALGALNALIGSAL